MISALGIKLPFLSWPWLSLKKRHNHNSCARISGSLLSWFYL